MAGYNQPRLAEVNFTRPGDTTAYTAKDVVGPSPAANLTFTGLPRAAGGGGVIVAARLMTSQSANVARYRLHLYHTAPTAIADNSPFTLLYANRANRIGWLDFPAAGTEGTGSDAANSIIVPGVANGNLPLLFECAEGVSAVYGILETLDGFTPANAQTFYLALSSLAT